MAGTVAQAAESTQPLPAPVLAYLEHVRVEKRLAARTHTLYTLDLHKLIAFAQTAKVELLALQVPHIRRFAAQMHSGGRSARGIALILSGWRGFFVWAARQGLVPMNPVDGVRAPRAPKPLPKALGVEDALQLVNHMNSDADPWLEARDAARAASAAVHLRRETADMRNLQRQQLDLGRLGESQQLVQVQRVERQRARGQALLDPYMLEIGEHYRRQRRRRLGGLRRRAAHAQTEASVRATGRMRASAALACSAMRIRNSVPMVASKRSGSGEPSTSMPNAGEGELSGPARSGSKASDCTESTRVSQPTGSKPRLGPQNGRVSDEAKAFTSLLTPMV